MKLRHFVSGSALVLTGWLAATFLYDMPAQRYQKLEKFPTTSRTPAPVKSGLPDTDLVAVSGSH